MCVWVCSWYLLCVVTCVCVCLVLTGVLGFDGHTYDGRGLEVEGREGGAGGGGGEGRGLQHALFQTSDTCVCEGGRVCVYV